MIPLETHQVGVLIADDAGNVIVTAHRANGEVNDGDIMSIQYDISQRWRSAANVINKSKISLYSETKRKNARDGEREGRSNCGSHEDKHGEVGREHCCSIRSVGV